MDYMKTALVKDNDLQRDVFKKYIEVRKRTELICSHLQNEDYVVQPVADVSPPKWHLAHTTWFFETFFLPKALPDYRAFNPDYNFLFNSYYETIGKRVLRTNRGNITRPGVGEIYAYREYVDRHMAQVFTQCSIENELFDVVNLGLQHEMQHQELLLTDIKYILGHNPIFPVYDANCRFDSVQLNPKSEFLAFAEGIYNIGFENMDHKKAEFSFDNEHNAHRVYLHNFEIATQPVSFGEFIEFIEDGGYQNFKFWHSDAWAWVNQNKIAAPLFMHKENQTWHRYSLAGYKPIKNDDTLMHVSFYEASAYAAWKGLRLPTEFEWEAAADHFEWGNCWEWTNSAYLPYPGFKTASGAIGEYNGKFMVNQMVLRGASNATAPRHSRKTYRNFFHPNLQWQFAGIRLAK